ncbi:MAG: serine protease [Pseudomonadales bacterium]|nr:serine protease [Pseudomonadales bacterium]
MKFSFAKSLIISAFSFLFVVQTAALSAADVTPRVVGGSDVLEAPSWMVYLASDIGACGGSMITDRWVLTAAHCVEDATVSETFIKWGDADLGSPSSQRVDVAEIHIHPDYRPIEEAGVPLNDLALLYLASSIPVDPISIPSLSLASTVASGDTVTTFGWGLNGAGEVTEQLQTADLEFRTQADCDAALLDDVEPGSVCAIATDATNCSGDSGGPLIASVGDSELLMGVVSYGSFDESIGTCPVDALGVYMSPAYYYLWIANTTGLISIEGDLNFGYLGVGRAFTETYRITNNLSSTITITDMAITGDDAAAFSFGTNACVSALAPNQSCKFTITAFSATAGAVSAVLEIEQGEGSVSFALSAEFLSAVAVGSGVSVNGAAWFSETNPWAYRAELGNSSSPGFISGLDSGDSVLLAHIEGPLTLSFSGLSLSSAAFDGVFVSLDGEELHWYRLDGSEESFGVSIPSGEHRVLFDYGKSITEGSQVALYNFHRGSSADTRLPSGNEDDDENGGSISLTLLLCLSLLLLASRTASGRRIRTGRG